MTDYIPEPLPEIDAGISATPTAAGFRHDHAFRL